MIYKVQHNTNHKIILFVFKNLENSLKIYLKQVFPNPSCHENHLRSYKLQ